MERTPRAVWLITEAFHFPHGELWGRGGKRENRWALPWSGQRKGEPWPVARGTPFYST